MAKDVESVLVEIAGREGRKSPEDAAAFIAGLKRTCRYQMDVY